MIPNRKASSTSGRPTLFNKMFPGVATPSSGTSYSAESPADAASYEGSDQFYRDKLAEDTSRIRAKMSEDRQWNNGQSLDSLRAYGFGDVLGGGGGAGGAGGSGGGFVPPTGGSGGTYAPAPVNYTEATPTRVPGVDAPDMTQANAQIFGRAKDQAGEMGRASLQSLRDELGATGMLGSGSETQGVRDIAARGQGQLGEVSRANAINESQQKSDFAKMKYQGDITQRGQDIAAQEAQARIALQRELARQQMLLEALRGMGGMGGRGGAGGSSGGGGGYGGGGGSAPSGGGGGGIQIY